MLTGNIDTDKLLISFLDPIDYKSLAIVNKYFYKLIQGNHEYTFYYRLYFMKSINYYSLPEDHSINLDKLKDHCILNPEKGIIYLGELNNVYNVLEDSIYKNITIINNNLLIIMNSNISDDKKLFKILEYTPSIRIRQYIFCFKGYELESRWLIKDRAYLGNEGIKNTVIYDKPPKDMNEYYKDLYKLVFNNINEVGELKEKYFN